MNDSLNIFGTDGIRGKANQYPITVDVALKLAISLAHIFRSNNQENKVVIAKDTRLSGYMLESVISAGFLSMGFNVILVGPMPTPSIPLLVKSFRADIGVMLSASHNPFHDNGIKIFTGNGFKLSDAQQQSISQTMQLTNLFKLPENYTIGRAKRYEDARGRYIESLKYSFPTHKSLKGFRIVVDCAHGATYRLAPSIFQELGADVFTVGVEPNGTNINHGCGALDTTLLQEKILQSKAHFGFAFDGDGDRVTVVDEKANVISSEHLLAFLASQWQNNNSFYGSVVVNEVTNYALDLFLSSKLDINVERTKVGDREISQLLIHNNWMLGGEPSGHIILNHISPYSDGILVALQLLALAHPTEFLASSISTSFKLMPQVSSNFPFPNDSNPLLIHNIKDQINNLIQHSQNKHNISVNVRTSGTEPLVRINVQGHSTPEIQKTIQQIQNILLS